MSSNQRSCRITTRVKREETVKGDVDEEVTKRTKVDSHRFRC